MPARDAPTANRASRFEHGAHPRYGSQMERARSLLAASRLLHPFPSFLVASVTVAIVPIANIEAPLQRYLALGLGMLLFQFAIGVLNDVVDLHNDRVAKPWKPLAHGTMSREHAALLAVALGLAGLLITAALPLGAWLIGALGLAAGIAYDVYLKRTTVSWLPFAVALPLVPIWVYSAVDAWTPLLWWTLPLGGLLGFGLHLANEAPDAADEPRGLPGRLGQRRSRVVAIATFAAVAFLTGLALVPESSTASVSAVIVGVVVVACSPRVPRLFGRDALFGLHAIGGAALTLVFLAAI